MRSVVALLVGVDLLACSGVKLPPVSPDDLEIYSEVQGPFPSEEYKTMATADETYNEGMCAREQNLSTCDDEQIWQFGLARMKEWAASLGADALLIHELGRVPAGNRYYAAAIYFPGRHPELQK